MSLIVELARKLSGFRNFQIQITNGSRQLEMFVSKDFQQTFLQGSSFQEIIRQFLSILDVLIGFFCLIIFQEGDFL